MALRPSTTSLTCTVSLIPQSIIIEKHWGKTDIRYSAEAHIYCSAQPSVFSHIVLNDSANTFISFNGSIRRLLCAVVVEAYFCYHQTKKNETLHDMDMILWILLFLSVVMQ